MKKCVHFIFLFCYINTLENQVNNEDVKQNGSPEIKFDIYYDEKKEKLKEEY